jgi:hypothetical protein
MQQYWHGILIPSIAPYLLLIFSQLFVDAITILKMMTSREHIEMQIKGVEAQVKGHGDAMMKVLKELKKREKKEEEESMEKEGNC